MSGKKRLGKLKPMHRFFLNPYHDSRFTNCPICSKPMKKRKKPFLVHVDPKQLVMLNMTGNYCPKDDLLILHQDKVEEMLSVSMLTNGLQEFIGNDYLVMGTVETDFWKKESKHGKTNKMPFDALHVFKEVLIFEPAHYGWVADDEDKKK